MNPYAIEYIIREKRELLLEEAKRRRLIAEYEKGLPNRRQRLFALIGNVLTSFNYLKTGLYEQGK